MSEQMPTGQQEPFPGSTPDAMAAHDDEIAKLEEARDYLQVMREEDEDFGRDVSPEAQEEVADYDDEIKSLRERAEKILAEADRTAQEIRETSIPNTGGASYTLLEEGDVGNEELEDPEAITGGE